MASYAGPARLRSPVSISSCEENVRSILCTGELKCHISRHTSCLPHMFIYSFYFICVYSFFSWHVRLGFRVLKYPRSGLLLTAQDWLASVVNFSRNIEMWFCLLLCCCYAMMLFNSFCHQGISSFAPHVTLFCIFSYRFQARTDFNFAYCSTDDYPENSAQTLHRASHFWIAPQDRRFAPVGVCQCLSVSVRSVSMLEFGFQRDRN